MRMFRTESVSYTVLLIILFTISALAVRHTLDFIESSISPHDFNVAAAIIWALTLGFMFLAGAFGLWAIQFSAERESRRRIGHLVDHMDYFSDGMVVLDRRGGIDAMNPTARQMAGDTPDTPRELHQAFPCLTRDDTRRLLASAEPYEIERTMTSGNPPSRVLRFRSQPADGILLILISDITSRSNQEAHHRAAARIQLVGQLGRGMAHDFNNLLCGIAGNLSLIERPNASQAEQRQSLEAISNATNRGLALSGHLLELSLPETGRTASTSFADALGAALEPLRLSLPRQWTIGQDIPPDLPPVPFPLLQLEQVIVNLALLVSESRPEPGHIRIVAGAAGSRPAFPADTPSNTMAIILTESPGHTIDIDQLQPSPAMESGVMCSLVESLVEGAGGHLDQLRGPGGVFAFRIRFPAVSAYPSALPLSDEKLPEALLAYLSKWKILLASNRPSTIRQFEIWMQAMPVELESITELPALLARIENGQDLTVAIVEQTLMGTEFRGLLRAITKLCPTVGIVLLEDRSQPTIDPVPDAIPLASTTDQRALITALIDARSLAIRRQTHTTR